MDVLLTGEVNGEMVETLYTAVRDATTNGVDTLYITVNSEGGSTTDALAIYEIMRTSILKFSVTACGFCASAAVLILAAGDTRRITKNTEVMVHEESLELSGKVSDLYRDVVNALAAEDHWNSLMAEHTKMSKDRWAEMKQDTYLSPSECLDMGLVDDII